MIKYILGLLLAVLFASPAFATPAVTSVQGLGFDLSGTFN